ncbi:MAG TPA: hypothetical protein VGP47_11450 [Parachlamydiaceae bacterium]|nr:hypothetical protein [Parachlamydiaceae bacterium]
MNNCLQLYNASLNLGMCPLWPVMPLIETSIQLKPINHTNKASKTVNAADEAYQKFLYMAVKAFELSRLTDGVECAHLNLNGCKNYLIFGGKISVVKVLQKEPGSPIDLVRSFVFTLFSDLHRIHALHTIERCLAGDWRLCAKNTVTWLGTHYISQ